MTHPGRAYGWLVTGIVLKPTAFSLGQNSGIKAQNNQAQRLLTFKLFLGIRLRSGLYTLLHLFA